MSNNKAQTYLYFLPYNKNGATNSGFHIVREEPNGQSYPKIVGHAKTKLEAIRIIEKMRGDYE